MAGQSEGSQVKELASQVKEGRFVQLLRMLEEASRVEKCEVELEKKFVLAEQESLWYANLSGGRCDELLRMLKENPLLLTQKGKGNVTVLHKAVHNGHVELVRYAIEEMFDKRGISAHPGNQLTLEDLLLEKNDREITAVMLAAMVGPWEGIHIFERAVKTCDCYQKAQADELHSTSDCQTNCSGIVGDPRLHEEHLRVDYIRGQNRIAVAIAVELALLNLRLESLNKRFSKATGGARDDLGRTEASQHRDVIEPIVKGVLDENDDDIRDLKDAYQKRDDYNSRRIEEVFFHFLCGCCEIYYDDGFEVRWKESAASVARKIVDKFKDHPDSLMFDLFDYLDPQGRTPLHVAGMAEYEVCEESTYGCCFIGEVLELVPKGKLYDRCANVRDGAGRTVFHQACILGNFQGLRQIITNGRVNLDGRVDLNARVNWDAKSKPDEEKRWFGRLVHQLLYWRSPGVQLKSLETWLEDIPPESSATLYARLHYPNLYPTGLHLLILCGYTDMLERFLQVEGQGVDVNARLWRGSIKSSLTPVQLAAALGHSKMVDILLKHRRVVDNVKLHGPRDESNKYSVIHVSAAYKRLKVLHTILENKEIYDPMITKTPAEQESPLHLVALTRKLPDPIVLEDILLDGDMGIIRRCLHKYKDLGNSSLQNNYDANDIVCINIMLQVGFDIWSGDKDGREPYPGMDATTEAYRWWYERVAGEVLNYKQKLNGAMGAISVIATLVATASFVGPLQPPLGYDGLDGYVQSSYALIRVYFVCNSLSFYFAVASILAAVTPAIPMLRESTQDEIRRSQRNSKIAIILLLISMIAILVSFSSSSVVVMRPFYSHDRRMMFYTIGVGASTCVVILVLFTIRMIGQMFNQPDLGTRFLKRFLKRFLFSKRPFSFRP